MSVPASAMENVNSVNHPPVNVVGINNDSASVKIINFLEDKKRKSKNTYDAYTRYYTDLFMFTCNKQINQITWDDIFSVTFSKVDDFKMYLLNKGQTGNTVNQKLFACKALWKKLYLINHDIDLRVWDFEEEEFEENNWAALSEDEIQLLFEFAEGSNNKNPLTRRMFFEFLYHIGCRKTVAQNLEWKDIQLKHDNKYNTDVYVVRYKDKGKWVEKAIHDDFMARLLKLKETESLGTKVFALGKEAIEETFKEFKDKYNLQTKNGKKVCIHSIKKSAGWLVQNTFHDLNKTRKFMQHNNPSTTAKIYIEDENYCEQASYMIGKTVDVDVFKGLDKDTLLKLIESCGKEVQLKMYYELEKMNG